jgi:two-component system response regulator FixJ
MRMPEMSGLELQRELQRRNSPLPLILITGHGDVPLAVSAMRGGAFDFLEKPVDDERLLESVGRALSQSGQTRRSVQESKEAAELIAGLTQREREVLDRLVLGMSNKLVAHELGISPRTVETHRARLQFKLKARDLSYLVRLSIAAGQMH